MNGAGTPLVAIAVTTAIALFLIAYSFVIYRRLEGRQPAPRLAREGPAGTADS